MSDDRVGLSVTTERDVEWVRAIRRQERVRCALFLLDCAATARVLGPGRSADAGALVAAVFNQAARGVRALRDGE